MSKRGFDTKYWTDPYVHALPPYEKLTYCYLINYPMGTVAGIFDDAPAQYAFDLGIPKELMADILNRLESDGKIVRVGGKVVLLNWCKHQAFNPSVLAGVVRELAALPQDVYGRLRQVPYALPERVQWGHVEALRNGTVSTASDSLSQAVTGSKKQLSGAQKRKKWGHKINGLLEQKTDSLSQGPTLNLTKPLVSKETKGFGETGSSRHGGAPPVPQTGRPAKVGDVREDGGVIAYVRKSDGAAFTAEEVEALPMSWKAV